MTHRLFSLLLAFVLLASNSATAQAQPRPLVNTSAEWVVQVPAAVPQARYGHGFRLTRRTTVYESRIG